MSIQLIFRKIYIIDIKFIELTLLPNIILSISLAAMLRECFFRFTKQTFRCGTSSASESRKIP